MSEYDRFPGRVLLSVAKLQLGDDAGHCATALALIASGHRLSGQLHHLLGGHGLSELKFSLLIVLFALDPSPSTPSDLAYHVGAKRSAVTEAIDALEHQHWVERRRDDQDRRLQFITLTLLGRARASEIIRDFVAKTIELTRTLDGDERASIAAACAKIRNEVARSDPQVSALPFCPSAPPETSQP